MPKGDSLKKYKSEQKFQTRQLLERTIKELKSSGTKVTVDQLASLCGISRATIYANYKDLLGNMPHKPNATVKKAEKEGNEKEALIEALREENKKLRQSNLTLMDQVVALKLLLEKTISSSTSTGAQRDA
jgi:AcrR family transcriptional regulator